MMENFLDRLFAFERNIRFAIYVGVAVAIFAIVFAAVIRDQRTVIAERMETADSLERREESLRRRINRRVQYEEQVRELELQLKLAVTKLPDEREIPALLSTVSSVGQESGLDIQLFRAMPENFRDFYAEVPVEMLVRGTYGQVASFLERLSKLNRVVNAIDISLRKPEQRDEKLILEVACKAVTFRFLSEAERKRIEEQKKRQR